LSEGESPQLLEGPAAFAAAALDLVRQARHELLLLSDALDRRLYGSPEFAESLKTFVLSSERAHLRVIVNQPGLAAQNIPRLLELQRRASSRIEFREPPDDRRQDCRRDWLIADRRTLLERRNPDALEVQLWSQAPQRGKLRGDTFDAIWNDSEQAQELRSLGM
jgi:hypothetical protein